MGDPVPRRRSVFLIGYRATGKTTIGRLLSRTLGVPFHDTDALVEEALGHSIAECFERQGEAVFREREAACLEELCDALESGGPAVVSTGGGIVLRDSNVRRMRDSGLVVWLRSDPATIRRRLENDPATRSSRPALAGRTAVEEVEEVLRSREPLYRGASHAEVITDAGDSPERCARSIAKLVEESGPVADS